MCRIVDVPNYRFGYVYFNIFKIFSSPPYKSSPPHNTMANARKTKKKNTNWTVNKKQIISAEMTYGLRIRFTDSEQII